MTRGGRTLSVSALLMLGAADLAFLNVWVFPRTSLAERLTRAMSSPVTVAVERPVPSAPAPVPPTPAEAPAAPAEAPPPPVEATAPPAPVEPPAPVRPERTRVFFAHNQHTLAPDAARALAVLARRSPGGRVLIEGHADRTGIEVYNDWLSQQRAEAVAGALAALGIDRQRMELRAYGSHRPAIESAEVKALRRNRRVEISFIEEVNRER